MRKARKPLAILRAVLLRSQAIFPVGFNNFGRRSRLQRPAKIVGRSGISIGNRVLILTGSWLEVLNESDTDRPVGPRLTIGDGAYVGRFACIVASNRVQIGQDAVLSDQVYISDSVHGINPLAGRIMSQPVTSPGQVIIEEGVFLGFRAVVLPGVTIGRHSVVGANAVVTRNVPPMTMVAGVPARVIKRFDVATATWVEQS